MVRLIFRVTDATMVRIVEDCQRMQPLSYQHYGCGYIAAAFEAADGIRLIATTEVPKLAAMKMNHTRVRLIIARDDKVREEHYFDAVEVPKSTTAEGCGGASS